MSFVLLFLAGLVSARFENVHPVFNQALTKLASREALSTTLVATRATEWKRLYKTQPDEAFRVADATRSASPANAGMEFPISGTGTITTTCGRPQHSSTKRRNPQNSSNIPTTLSLAPLIWTPLEDADDECYDGVTINKAFYLLRLSPEHPFNKAKRTQSTVALDGYVFQSSQGSPELFARMPTKNTPLQSLSHLEVTTKRRLSLTTCSSSTDIETMIPVTDLGLAKKMCVVRYTLTDGKPVRDYTGADITNGRIQDLMLKVNKFFKGNSYNKFGYATPVQIFNVQGTVQAGIMDNTQMLLDWRAAYPGIWCTCDAEIIVFNYNMGGFRVNFGGQAYLGHQGIWINGNVDVATWIHEIGHNLGFYHARQYQLASVGSSWLGAGSITEYGDQFDVMGSGAVTIADSTLAETDVAYFNAIFRAFQLKNPWISSSQMITIGQNIPGGSMDVVLFPSDSGMTRASEKLVIQFQRPVDIVQKLTVAGQTVEEVVKFGRFFFEYKSAKMASSFTKRGLLVHACELSPLGYSVLLDNTPQTLETEDSALSFGLTFSDCTYGVHVTAEQIDCPGDALNSMKCARVMLRNGNGGVNIGLAVTDANTKSTCSSAAVGVSVNLKATLSGFDPVLNPATVYFDWGEGVNSKGLTASHSWATSGIKTVTVIATSLDSAATQMRYKVKVGNVHVSRLITASTNFLEDKSASFGSLLIGSATAGFTISMMLQFTDASRVNHELWQLGGFSLTAYLNASETAGYYFPNGQPSYAGPAPFFKKIAQAAVVVEKMGTTSTITVYIDGVIHTVEQGITTPWPGLSDTLKVGSCSGSSTSVGGVVTRLTVYNWALSSTDLALDAAGGDVTNLAPVLVGSSSGCMPAPAPTTLTPTLVPTKAPTRTPTTRPTLEPTRAPTVVTLVGSTVAQGSAPSTTSLVSPSTRAPSQKPTQAPSRIPTSKPTRVPTAIPTKRPTKSPSLKPTKKPTILPTVRPSKVPTFRPTQKPTKIPSMRPTKTPTKVPTLRPTKIPTSQPTLRPTKIPTTQPTKRPTST